VTSRVEGHADQGLLREKGGRGFPHLVFMDGAGTVVQTIGGWRDVQGLELTGWALDAQAGADGPDVAMAKLVLDKASLADTRAALENVILTEVQQKRWTVLEPHFELAELDAQVQSKSLSIGDAGARLVGWLGTAKEPTAGTDHMTFWRLLMGYAEANKDAALFEKCTGVLRAAFTKAFGNHPQLPKLFEKWDNKLAELKGGQGQ
jgi:hypothetical protein